MWPNSCKQTYSSYSFCDEHLACEVVFVRTGTGTTQALVFLRHLPCLHTQQIFWISPWSPPPTCPPTFKTVSHTMSKITIRVSISVTVVRQSCNCFLSLLSCFPFDSREEGEFQEILGGANFSCSSKVMYPEMLSLEGRWIENAQVLCGSFSPGSWFLVTQILALQTCLSLHFMICIYINIYAYTYAYTLYTIHIHYTYTYLTYTQLRKK